MILIPLFLVLFACWMLWGWTVGESKDIKWLRRWCAPIFVVTVILISAGAGAVVTQVLVRQNVRHEVAELLEAIDRKISTGDAGEVVSEIRATDRHDDPDRDAFDLLDHLPVMHQNLSAPTEVVAERPGPSVLR